MAVLITYILALVYAVKNNNFNGFKNDVKIII